MRGNFIYERLGEKIQILRKKKGLSQEQLAIASDIDRSYLAEIEQGKANPTFKTLNKIARGLRIKIKKLVENV